jgi:hypothetical protein
VYYVCFLSVLLPGRSCPYPSRRVHHLLISSAGEAGGSQPVHGPEGASAGAVRGEHSIPAGGSLGLGSVGGAWVRVRMEDFLGASRGEFGVLLGCWGV